MEIDAILKAVSALAQLSSALAPVVKQALAVASETDAATIKAAIAQMQAENDDLFGQVQDELRG